MADIDIGEVFAHYGEHTGKRMVQCLFHEDKTPSCSVNYNKGVFNCHSCGRAGNGWTVIMEKENLPYWDATQWASDGGLVEAAQGPSESLQVGTAYGGRRNVGSRKRAYRPSWKRSY